MCCVAQPAAASGGHDPVGNRVGCAQLASSARYSDSVTGRDIAPHKRLGGGAANAQRHPTRRCGHAGTPASTTSPPPSRWCGATLALLPHCRGEKGWEGGAQAQGVSATAGAWGVPGAAERSHGAPQELLGACCTAHLLWDTPSLVSACLSGRARFGVLAGHVPEARPGPDSGARLPAARQVTPKKTTKKKPGE